MTATGRGFLRLAALFFTVAMLTFGVTGIAAVLPTDSQKLVIETQSGPVEFSVELALTPGDRATGLMNRENMPPDHGMLFRFDQIRPVTMWMKNTPLSLDMLFIDENGTLVGIAPNTTPFSENFITSPGPVRYVLELNAGTAVRLGITAGDKVRHRAITE